MLEYDVIRKYETHTHIYIHARTHARTHAHSFSLPVNFDFMSPSVLFELLLGLFNVKCVISRGKYARSSLVMLWRRYRVAICSDCLIKYFAFYPLVKSSVPILLTDCY